MGADMTQAVQPLGNNTVEFSVFINYTPCSLVRCRGFS